MIGLVTEEKMPLLYDRAEDKIIRLTNRSEYI